MNLKNIIRRYFERSPPIKCQPMPEELRNIPYEKISEEIDYISKLVKERMSFYTL